MSIGSGSTDLIRYIDLEKAGLILRLPEGWGGQETLIEDESPSFLFFRSTNTNAYDAEMASEGRVDALHSFRLEMHGYFGMMRRSFWAKGWDFWGIPELDNVKKKTRMALKEEQTVSGTARGYVYLNQPDERHPVLKYWVFYMVRGSKSYRVAIGGAYEESFCKYQALYEEILQGISFSE